MHFYKSFRINVIISVIILISLISGSDNSFAQKLTLKILIKPAGGQVIKLVGFEGLKTDSFASVKLDEYGAAELGINYHGLVLLSFANGATFPIIVNNSLTHFSILYKDSLPVLYDNENRFLYSYLTRKKDLSSRQSYIKNALATFSDNHPFKAKLIKEKDVIIAEQKKLEKMLDDSSRYQSSYMLKGMSLLELQTEVKTQEDLKVQKKIIIRFLDKNGKRVFYTNIIQQMATQYVQMDEFVAKTVDEQYSYISEDIGVWIKSQGKEISSRDIVNFYINYFMSRSLVGITGKLTSQYLKYVQCIPSINKGIIQPDYSLLYSADKDYKTTLIQLKDSLKILYFFQSDCPACFGPEMMLNRYLQGNKVKIPLIVVFSHEKAESAFSTLTNLVLEPFYYTDSEWLYNFAGIQKCPAYAILGKNNTILFTCYSMNDLINYLGEK